MEEKIQKKVILVVDDTPTNIDIVNNILSSEYKVKAAINGKLALKIVGKKKPDLVLLDIMMPEMDGYEVCRQIKADDFSGEVPIIFLTSSSDEADVEKGLALGAVDYIMKPIDPAILIESVKKYIG